MAIAINPERIRSFGESTAGIFCLVTNTRYGTDFTIEKTEKYPQTKLITIDREEEFPHLLADGAIPDGAHILTILPDCLLHSVPQDALAARKLLIMACRSGRTTLEGIEHFLRAGEQTDPDELDRMAEAFFEKGERAEALKLVNQQHGTSAIFNHPSDLYEWHEQLGTLEPGQQQVFPAGEIACFLVPLKITELPDDLRLDVTGQIALQGGVIVQSGPPSFLLEDQERIYQKLATIRENPLILDVECGYVTRATASSPECRPAEEILNALFEVDSRYRRIYEIGFSLNRHVRLWPGNSAMNEVCGGANGTVHLGLGMLPHTQYHLDIFCTGTTVHGRDDEILLGRKPMVRHRSAACPCMEY